MNEKILEKQYCQLNVADLDYYYTMDDCLFFVRDLAHEGTKLIKQALEKPEIKVYGGLTKRCTAKQKWLKHVTVGKTTPIVKRIELSNGCKLFDYSVFDPSPDATLEDMNKVVAEIAKISTLPLNKIHSCCDIINHKLYGLTDRIAEISCSENFEYYSRAARGGANAIFTNDIIPYETHIDYHQLYSFCMTHFEFPMCEPEVYDGYRYADFAIYSIMEGVLQLKKDGFPIISQDSGGMFGEDGKPHKAEELVAVTSTDLDIILQNYDVLIPIGISRSFIFNRTAKGSRYFGSMVDEFYEGRKNNTGAVKRFYKQINEIAAGAFQRQGYVSCYWKTLEHPTIKEVLDSPYHRKNPMIGMFITSYGRTMLNKILHMFPHNKVIGYDTDCVFFAGKPEEVPHKVMKLFGDEIGQLHFDGIYKDVTHIACKNYSGWDLEKNKPFRKQSGLSKTGFQKRWNNETKEWDIVCQKRKK